MNNSVLSRLDAVWAMQPNKAMLVCDNAGLTYRSFRSELEHAIEQLESYQPKAVTLLADNSVHWVITDLACQCLDIPLLPLPVYFTPEQMQHSIANTGCDLLLIESAMTKMMLPYGELVGQLNQYSVVRLPTVQKDLLPANTGKVTFTSGSTGAPKGVCLSNEHQWQVAESIRTAINKATWRHLCILPLSTLLENIAGVYAALLNATTVIMPGLATLGFSGSSSLDIQQLLEQITQLQPSSLITTPEILTGIVTAAGLGWRVPNCLEYVAVGGARVAPGLLERAHNVDIAAYQGYGLSECGSVVSLNVFAHNDKQTMGVVLPHADVAIEEGEIIVYGATFLGYANNPDSWGQNRVATGDLGDLTDDGYLVVTGRKKNLLISSFGRNINPEWVEAELLASPLIKQAFVFGDSKPYCVAAIVPASKDIHPLEITQWLEQLNSLLPDYAQVKQWFIPQTTINSANGLLTNNGRPKRQQLLTALANEIDALYTNELSLQEA